MNQNDIMAAIKTLHSVRNCFYNESVHDNELDHEVLNALDLAISALEKQIPKRPQADGNGSVEYAEYWLECPLCGEIIPEYTSENETDCYCVGCGQKLDWSDSNG